MNAYTHTFSAVVVFFLYITAAISQNPVINFENRIVANFIGDNADNSFQKGIYHAGENAFFAFGQRKSGNTAHATITKLDACGGVLWTRTYFTDQFLAAYIDAEIMNDGNILALGSQRPGPNTFTEKKKTISKIDP